MSSQAGFLDRLRDVPCFSALMGFFFNKGVRGGPRILLNLASVLLILLLIAKLMPSRVTEGALGAIPHDLWSGISGSTTAEDDSVAGGLRIVVFGENDIGTPVGKNQEVEGSKSWTQALCDQLECTKHISMVPSPDSAAWSVSSNQLYARGVEKVFNETADKSTPGMDYSYLSTYYPPQWKSPDLKEQIDRFLAMPKPRYAPEETLWVFSFGLWDVWSLSALPISVGKELAGDMTKDIFKQIDRLYEASTNPNSIAWSDINVPTAEAASTNASEETEKLEPAEVSEKREEDAGNGEAAAEEQAAEGPTEYFRILMPRVMDPSLLPGWRDLRPILPKVHSKAEQMRNCVDLTNSWNDGIVNGLSDWVKKENKKPEEEQKEGEKKEARDDAPEAEGERAEAAAAAAAEVSPSEAEPEAEAEAADSFVPTEAAVEHSAPPVRYPMRDGYAYNLADYLRDTMVERQMRNARLKDGSGRGDGPLEEGYRDVSNSCVQPVSTVPVSISVESGITLDIPNRNIGKDVQVPTPSTPQVSRREENNGNSDDTTSAGFIAQASSTVKVCQIPSDYLFYTPFALSQRAIIEIASQSAELIRKSDTIRSKLQGK